MFGVGECPGLSNLSAALVHVPLLLNSTRSIVIEQHTFHCYRTAHDSLPPNCGWNVSELKLSFEFSFSENAGAPFNEELILHLKISNSGSINPMFSYVDIREHHLSNLPRIRTHQEDALLQIAGDELVYLNGINAPLFFGCL